MTAKILDGNMLAESIRGQLKKEVKQFEKQTGWVPTLVSVVMGDDEASLSYVKSQEKTAEYIGIDHRAWIFKESNPIERACDFIDRMNGDSGVNGIIIQRPIPRGIELSLLNDRISADKDSEGLSAVNLGRILLGEKSIIPCTPASVLEFLNLTGTTLYGKEVVIVGNSAIVGKPLSMLLSEQLATVTICNIATSREGYLEGHVKRADILIVAVGKPSLIKGDWVKPGAIVIDVGTTRVKGKIVGDVEFKEASERASFITPVPGGVGLVTPVMLMKNVVEAFKTQIQQKESIESERLLK